MRRNNGFTLVEVLIAAVILFSALAVTAQLYSASSLSAEKAAKAARFYQLSGAVITSVKSQLRHAYSEQKLSSALQGEIILQGHSYEWQASRIATFGPPQNPEEEVAPPHRFARYRVEVISELDNKSYTFEASAW